jgi:nucleobase:cation symporter-1, NCS1 family
MADTLPGPATSTGRPSVAIEQKGIERLGDAERRGRPSGLFWMWAGAVWNVEFLVYGTAIASHRCSTG